jgi:replicative superfamily II helicase
MEYLEDENRKHVDAVLDAHGFDELTETQEYAFKNGAMEDGNHLLIAETGNGKTLVAESKVRKTLSEGEQVAYLVPSTRLVNDKYDEISEWADGSWRVKKYSYSNADVTVATFESYYYHVLNNPANAKKYGLVVQDDFHEMYSSFRGPGIEKGIAATLEAGTNMFSMSATIGEPEEVAEWINADLIVSLEERASPIREFVVDTGESNKQKGEQLTDFLRKQKEDTPFLIFNYSRRNTESRAEKAAEASIFRRPSVDYREKLRSRLGGALNNDMEDLANMMKHGVAYNHAGLEKDIRDFVVEEYKNGNLKAIFCTTTLAYGFDGPVQSVVIADAKRREYIHVYEYQQMIGRAARPGYGFDEGYAITLSNNPEEVQDRFFDPRELEQMESHVSTEPRFRWLLLELMEAGWDTHQEIESFIISTLFWKQLEPGDPWREENDTHKEDLLREKLADTADWLEEHDLAKYDKARNEFETTARGDAAVEFDKENFADANLRDIVDLFDWLEDNPQPSRLEMTWAAAEKFGRTISHSGDPSREFTELVEEANLDGIGDATDTAILLRYYWCSNIPEDDIETRTGYDIKYMRSTARKLSDYIESTKHLFGGTTEAQRPDWIENYAERIEKGVRRSELPLVRNVDNVGRYRVRRIREGVSKNVEFNEGQRFPEAVGDFYRDRCDEDRDKLEASLRNIHGVGKKTAPNVADLLVDIYLDGLVQTDDSILESGGGGGRETSLREFD